MEARGHGLATGHRYWFGRPVAYQQPYVRAAVPTGFLSASAEAMTHHLIAQLNGGRYQTTRVLSPAGIAQLHRPPPRSPTTTTSPTPWAANGHNALSTDREGDIAWGVLGRLVGRQLAAPPSISVNQTLFFVMLGVVVRQVLGIARSIVLLRRWRAQPARRPRGLIRVTARVVLPLLVGLAWALVCLVGLPMLGGSLREAAADTGWLLVAVLDDLHWANRASLLLTTPDLGWLLVASGTVSLVWGVTRAVLAVSTLRRAPSIPPPRPRSRPSARSPHASNHPNQVPGGQPDRPGPVGFWDARMRRPARRAGPIVRPPRFRPEWADEGGPSTGHESIGRTPIDRGLGKHCSATCRGALMQVLGYSG